MKYPKIVYKPSQNAIELKKVDIEGNVCGEFVEFTINHVYENKGKGDVEAVYNFPIPETAVLSGFEANIGGRTIKGKVEGKDEIEKILNNVVEQGNSNFLLEEFNENNFRISIAKILSGETINIKISYIEELIYDNNKLKLTIPKVVPPIKAYSNSKKPLTAIKSNHNYKLNLNLLVESFEEIKITCPSHHIEVEGGENNVYKVTVADVEQKLNEDMLIYLEEKVLQETTGMVYENYKDKNGILYLRFIPDIQGITNKKYGDYIYLIDISESMKGDKFKAAKRALQLCLRNLTEFDTFNIVAMGDKLHYFSVERKVRFNEESLRNASTWIDNLQSEEDAVIFDGIKYAFENEAEGEENTILLFTDDIVDDEKEILDYVDEVCRESRIFPFGIDASVNTYFINKLARITYGKAEFINGKRRIEDSVLKQFNRIRGLQVTDIELDWGNMKVEKTYPRTIEYMYDEEPFSIFAKVEGQLEGVVTLRGKVGNRRIQRRISLTNLDLEVNANLIDKVWHKKRLESIENRIVYERGEVYNSMKNKIVELSTKVGIISTETSFILLEELYEPVLGIAMRKFLPIKVNDVEEDDAEATPSFYYNHSSNGVSFTEEILSLEKREELLRILATQQLANGAFANSYEEEKYTKFISTIKGILAFTLGKEDINIYKNLLGKALGYIMENAQEEINNDDAIIPFLYLTLKTALNKGIIKSENREVFINKSKELQELLNNKDIDSEKIEEEFIYFIESNMEGQDTLNTLIDKTILKTK
ncbi:VIT and VWA domain-containing protein [Clostridium sp.]|uniref:VIT and vWA domain-containing protein n=1 Tax=Clostridium sp. TaxID=1506 RepID=UPI002FC6A43D